MQRGSSSPIFSKFSPFGLLFPSLKTNLRGRNFGSNEGVIHAIDEYLGGQEEGVYLQVMSKLEQHWRERIEEKETILRNNGTISAFGHSQSTGAENFLIIPREIDPFSCSSSKAACFAYCCLPCVTFSQTAASIVVTAPSITVNFALFSCFLCCCCFFLLCF